MRKREPESDFKLEYSTYYRLINVKERKIWGKTDGEKTPTCHFHTPEEISIVMEMSKRMPTWTLEKCFYDKPIRI